jgi:glycosyltransferase involved in cell wall biosynthesis
LFGEATIIQHLHAPATQADHARVVMLVANSCVNDTRVIRAAETVAQQGFDTVVLALSDDGVTSEERRNDVLYRRIGRPWHPMRLPESIQTVGLFERFWGYIGAKAKRLVARLDKSGHQRVSVVLAHLVSAFDKVALTLDRMISDRPFPQAQIRLVLGLSRCAVLWVFNAVWPKALRLRPVFETRRMRRLFKPHLMMLKPDIIHAHDLVTLPAGAAAAAALKARLIYDAHELEVHRNTNTGPIDKWLRYYFEGKYITQCDAVVTVCDSIADHLGSEYGIPRPTVVMNAPDAEAGHPSHTDLRTTLGLTGDTPLAVYVGRITVGRGIEQIVDALQYLPGYHLALVGPVNKPTLEEAEKAAEALGVADRLHVVPPVPPEMVISFISSGDISIVPIQNVCLSYYYCLPNKLLESAIARLPVVVSDLPELKRFVEISKSGIVMDQTDPRDIARAIRDAYENRDRLRPDTNRLLHAEAIYGWQRQKEALIELYSSSNLPVLGASPNSVQRQSGGG